MSEELTPKQEKFVCELIKGKSQRAAYKAAYDAENMADATIDSHACRLLKKDKVTARYNELKNKVEDKAEKQAVMSALEVLKEIEGIARSDISEYLAFRTEQTVVGYDKKTGKPIMGYAPIVDLKDSRTVNTKNIQEVSLGANGSFKFKMYSREVALYKLLDLHDVKAVEKAKLQLARERLELDKDNAEKKDW